MKRIRFLLTIAITAILVCTSVSCKKNVTGVELDRDLLTLSVDDSYRLRATVLPVNAEDKRVTWSSSNSNVATVANDGLVTAKSEGNAVITVTTKDGNKTAKCTVTVNNHIVAKWLIDSVEVDIEFEDDMDESIQNQILEEINNLIPFQNETDIIWDFWNTGKVKITHGLDIIEESYSMDTDELTVGILTGKYNISYERMIWTIDRTEDLASIGVIKAIVRVEFSKIQIVYVEEIS